MGATFAYFTASTTTTGETEATIETTKLQGATIQFTSEDSKFELLKYPGGIAVYGSKATIAKQEMSDPNDYQATFNLKIDYTNNTGTDMDWELYMVESQVDDLDPKNTTTCKFRQQKNDVTGETQYWYSDDESTPVESDEGCKATAIINKISTTLHGTKIASGKLLNGKDTEQHITKDTETEEYTKGDGTLEDRVINTNNKQSKYYYLVVKYPNQNKNQSTTDAGKTFSVKLSIDGKPASTVYQG